MQNDAHFDRFLAAPPTPARPPCPSRSRRLNVARRAPGLPCTTMGRFVAPLTLIRDGGARCAAWSVAAVLLCVTLSGCLVGGGSRTPATVTVHDRAPTLLPSQQQEATGSGPTAPQQSAPAIPGDGTFRVGVDIRPGTYRSEGSDGCYWERSKGLSGSSSDIIANSAAPGPQIVEIAPTDVAFKTSNCAPWEMTGSLPAAGSPPSVAAASPSGGALPANAQPCPATAGPSGAFSRSAAGSPATSCPFAEQVRVAYAASGAPTALPRRIRAVSPVTGDVYEMTCATGASVATCTGGDFAVVYLY